jgi:transposase
MSATHLAGIDWATQKHDVCLVDAEGKVVGEQQFANTRAGLDRLCSWLLADGREATQVHVAIETPRGLIIDALLDRGFTVFAINPKQLDRFRDRFSPSGAKDDRLDARVLADSLRTDQRAFRQLETEHPLVVQLREWLRMREDAVEEVGALSNKLREQLGRFWPEVRNLMGGVPDDWFLALLDKIPTPAVAQKRQCARIVASVLKKHRVKRVSVDQVVQALRTQHVTAPGVVEGVTARIQHVLERLAVAIAQRKESDVRIQALLAELDTEGSQGAPDGQPSDVAIMLSFPGIGTIVAAALLTDGARYIGQRDYSGLRIMSGVAPVSRITGKRCGSNAQVSMRRACSKRLANAMQNWARVAAQRSEHWGVRFRQIASKHPTVISRARRGLADNMLRVLVGMLKTRTLYDEHRFRPKAAA